MLCVGEKAVLHLCTAFPSQQLLNFLGKIDLWDINYNIGKNVSWPVGIGKHVNFELFLLFIIRYLIYPFIFNELFRNVWKGIKSSPLPLICKWGGMGVLNGLFSILLYETADSCNARLQIHTNLRNTECQWQAPCFCREKTNSFILTRLLTPQPAAGTEWMKLGELPWTKSILIQHPPCSPPAPKHQALLIGCHKLS